MKCPFTSVREMKVHLLLLVIFTLTSCGQSKSPSTETILWTPYNDSAEVAANRDHQIPRMRYKLIQSNVLDKNEVFRPLFKEVSQMSETAYNALKPLILEQNIPAIQDHIAKGNLTYEQLVLFYLYRIYLFELDNTTTLNTIIALNEKVVKEARERDEALATTPSVSRHPIFGMPILLKDNIDTKGMKTTAGAIALIDNDVDDAFIVTQLKKKGALILGKVNMSEWAYYLCSGCPVGYSAVGGQTLNPYGRRVFETGGSSSGSGTATAANYAVGAVGTETSGSILSPSGQNSVVGLKPTIGLLGRSGIVPISSTLDTPGPMTKNVVDNAILLSAMVGNDEEDSKSATLDVDYLKALNDTPSLQGKRLGAMTALMESDSVYRSTVANLKKLGVEIVVFTPPEVQLDDFLSILNIDMRNDLPKYLDKYTDPMKVKIASIADAVDFNAMDSLVRIPYGQAIFMGILKDSTTTVGLEVIKSDLEQKGRSFFDTAIDQYHLDAVLSINNRHAGYAAVAKYPALTVPMGYKATGEPINLTFIGKQFQEDQLLRLGRAFELMVPARKAPEGYR